MEILEIVSTIGYSFESLASQSFPHVSRLVRIFMVDIYVSKSAVSGKPYLPDLDRRLYVISRYQRFYSRFVLHYCSLLKQTSAS